MGATKYDFYSDDLISSAELFKAIGHPARLKALVLIANSSDKDITVNEIMNEISLSRSTLSVHIKKLSDSGLIKTNVMSKKGKSFVSYRLNKPAFDHILSLISDIHTKLKNKDNDNLESTKWFFARLKSTLEWSSFYST